MPKPVRLRSVKDPRTLSELGLIVGVMILVAGWWWERDRAAFLERAVPVQAVVVGRTERQVGGRNVRTQHALVLRVPMPDGSSVESSLDLGSVRWDRTDVGDHVDVLMDSEEPTELHWPGMRSVAFALPWVAGLVVLAGAVRGLLGLYDRRKVVTR